MFFGDQDEFNLILVLYFMILIYNIVMISMKCWIEWNIYMVCGNPGNHGDGDGNYNDE